MTVEPKLAHLRAKMTAKGATQAVGNSFSLAPTIELFCAGPGPGLGLAVDGLAIQSESPEARYAGSRRRLMDAEGAHNRALCAEPAGPKTKCD
ncbi:hypothetical protein A5764_14100 [Mycobacterium sp. 852002-51057_SCH5723018]|nr:hypothetical protein A5764_14100 [Mycobacterium sp. 852002-51057_SCH5723018]